MSLNIPLIIQSNVEDAMKRVDTAFNNAFDSVEDAIKKANDAQKKMMDNASKTADKMKQSMVNATDTVKAKVKQMSDAAKKSFNDISDAAKKASQDAGGGIAGMVEGFKAGFGALPVQAKMAIGAIGAVGAAVVALGSDYVQVAKEIKQFSRETDMSAESFQKWRYLFGGDEGAVKGAMDTIVGGLKDAKDASSELGQIYKQLGVTVTTANGDFKSQESILGELTTALTKVENTTERARLATLTIGGDYRKIAEYLDDGTQAWMGYVDAGEKAIIMTNEQVEAGVRLGKQWDSMIGNIKGLIYSGLEPLVSKFSELLGIQVPLQDGISNTSTSIGILQKDIQSMTDSNAIDAAIKGIDTLSNSIYELSKNRYIDNAKLGEIAIELQDSLVSGYYGEQKALNEVIALTEKRGKLTDIELKKVQELRVRVSEYTQLNKESIKDVMAEKRAQLEIQKLRLANRPTDKKTSSKPSTPEVLNKQLDAIEKNSQRLMELTKVIEAKDFNAQLFGYKSMGELMNPNIRFGGNDKQTATGTYNAMYNVEKLIPGLQNITGLASWDTMSGRAEALDRITGVDTKLAEIEAGWQQITDALKSSEARYFELDANIGEAVGDLADAMDLNPKTNPGKNALIAKLEKEISDMEKQQEEVKAINDKNLVASRKMAIDKKLFNPDVYAKNYVDASYSAMVETTKENVTQLMKDMSIDIQKDLGDRKYSIMTALFGKNDVKKDIQILTDDYKVRIKRAVAEGLKGTVEDPELVAVYTEVYDNAINQVIDPLTKSTTDGIKTTFSEIINSALATTDLLWGQFSSTMNSWVSLSDTIHDNDMKNKEEKMAKDEEAIQQQMDGIVMSERARAKAEKRLAKLAEQNQQKIQDAEKDYLEKKKTWSITEATINGIVAVSKTFADYGFTPVGIAMAALQALETTGHIATIAAQKYFNGGIIGGAKGASYGKDNTVVQAREGEIVMNAPQQKGLWDFISRGIMPNRSRRSEQPMQVNASFVINGDVTPQTVKQLKKNQNEFLSDLERGIKDLKRYGRI